MLNRLPPLCGPALRPPTPPPPQAKPSLLARLGPLRGLGEGTPAIRFPVILADPPWAFRDKGTRLHPGYVGRARREAAYKVAPNERIIAMGPGVQRLAADEALLFLWCPNALVLEGVGTATARAWGFVPKQLLPWLKVSSKGSPKIGGGHYSRVCTEQLILAVRGAHPTSLIKDRAVAGVFFDDEGQAVVAPVPLREGLRHSAKPDAVYILIERLCDGPYLELFARRCWSDQWTVMGDEAPGGGELIDVLGKEG